MAGSYPSEWADDSAGHDGDHADLRIGVLPERCDFAGREDK